MRHRHQASSSPGDADPDGQSRPGPVPGDGWTTTDRTDRQPPPRDRAESDLLAVVLLTGLVVIGGVLVLVTGTAAVDQGTERIDEERAETSLTEFDRRVESAGVSRTRTEQVDLGFSGAEGGLRRTDHGTLNVTVRIDNRTIALVHTSLGEVAYEGDSTTVAYQGGGVWRGDGDHSTMVSGPSVSRRDDTLGVELVALSGNEGLGSTVEVKTTTPDRAHPAPEAGSINPMGRTAVRIAIQSQFYRAWGDYFEQRVGGPVVYHHERDTVVLWIRASGLGVTRSGVIATSRTGSVELAGTGAYVDSYDSSEGTYVTTVTENGTVEAAGDVLLDGDATIAGDVRSGSEVEMDGHPTITGDVGWTDDIDSDDSALIAGETEQIDGVTSIPPIDEIVAGRTRSIRAENDNDATGAIVDGELDASGTTVLESGRYYLEDLSLEGEELVLDTTNGDIMLGVRDYVHLEKANGDGAEISVVGNGTVRTFVAGENETTVSPTGLGSRDVNLHIGKQSAIRTPDHDARQFRLFGPRSFVGTVAGGNGPSRAVLDGVIYAPAGAEGEGYVHLKQSEVYGAVVTGDLIIGQYGQVHFDQALSETRMPAASAGIDYLHVVLHEMEVES